jgi:cytochrome P450
LRQTVARYFERKVLPHAILFPSLSNYHILPSEKERQLNTISCRDYIRELLKKRRGQPKNGDDLLSLLFQEPLFANDDEVIVEELLYFIFTGGFTSANAAQNLMLYLLKHPQYEAEIL